jgi:hypothetical protein
MPRQSVASTHEISGSPPPISLAEAPAGVRAVGIATRLPGPGAAARSGRATALVGCAMAVAGTATPPSAAANATSPEMAILCT